MGKAVIEHIIRVQDQGLLAKDDTQRESIKADAYKLIDEASSLGYIEGSSVAETKRIWEEQFDQRAAASYDANTRAAVLGGGAAVADAGAYSYLHSKLAAHQENTHVTELRGDFAKSLAGFLQAAPAAASASSLARGPTRTRRASTRNTRKTSPRVCTRPRSRRRARRSTTRGTPPTCRGTASGSARPRRK